MNVFQQTVSSHILQAPHFWYQPPALSIGENRPHCVSIRGISSYRPSADIPVQTSPCLLECCEPELERKIYLLRGLASERRYRFFQHRYGFPHHRLPVMVHAQPAYASWQEVATHRRLLSRFLVSQPFLPQRVVGSFPSDNFLGLEG